MKFRLVEDAAFYLLGARKTLFIRSEQKLFELDDITALLACRLYDAASFGELNNELITRGLTQQDATRTLKQLLIDWSRKGWLELRTDDHTSPVRCQTIRLASLDVRLKYHDGRLAGLIAPLFEHLSVRCASAPLSYDLVTMWNKVGIARKGTSGRLVELSEVVPTLKACLTKDVLNGLRDRIALHAAHLASDRGSLLLVGPPGAGKSTLALALSLSGFQYDGDDIAVVDETGNIEGVSFAPTLKAGSWQLFKEFGNRIFDSPIHHRSDGERARYIHPNRYGGASKLPLRTIVVLDRRLHERAHSLPLEPLKVLEQLCVGASTSTSGLSLRQFERLAGLASNARGIRLTYSALSAAVERICHEHEGRQE